MAHLSNFETDIAKNIKKLRKVMEVEYSFDIETFITEEQKDENIKISHYKMNEDSKIRISFFEKNMK